jgi:hypothetical protein
MNIEINWEEVDSQIVAITVDNEHSLIGWTSVPRWNDADGCWQSSNERGDEGLWEFPTWIEIDPKRSLQLRPAEPRFRVSGNGQAIVDTLSGEGACIPPGMDGAYKRQLLDLLNRVDREGR